MPARVPRPRREDEHSVLRSNLDQRTRQFLAGGCDDAFPRRNARPVPVSLHERDRATKLLSYIADVIVNGHPERATRRRHLFRRRPRSHARRRSTALAAIAMKGTRDNFKELGAAKFAQWVREQKRLLVTDTTMRDAHQSLLATRMRTCDMLAVADALRPRARRPVLARNVGRGHVRHRDAVPQGIVRGTGSPKLREVHSEHPVPDARAGRRTRSATRTTPTTWSHEFVRRIRRSGHGRVPHLRRATTGCPTCKLGMDAVLKTHAICEGGDLLHRRHSRPESATSSHLTTTSNLAKELEKTGHALPRDQGHGRVAEAVRGEKVGEGAAQKRSACRFTSTRTTPPAGRSLPT